LPGSKLQLLLLLVFQQIQHHLLDALCGVTAGSAATAATSIFTTS
jgi:hypothetical protein